MNTDSLGTLKKGWSHVRFGEVVKQAGEKTDPEADGIERYVAGEHMESDDLRIRRWGTVGDGYLGPAFHKRFRPGQVLYGSRRTYLRKVAVADFDGVCANTTFVLVSMSERLLQDFLPHVMSTESFHAYSIGKSRGSTNPYVNFSDLVDYEFALPPLEEQKRIVELLVAATSVCEAAKGAVAFTSELLFALETEIFAGAAKKPLSSVVEVRLGRQRSPKNALGDNMVPYLRAANVKHGALILEDVKSMNFTPVEQDVFRVACGDVLVTEGCGSLKELGASAVWDLPDEETICLQNTLLRLRAKDRNDQEFVWFWADFAFQSGLFAGIASGTSIFHLSVERTKSLPFPDLRRQEVARSIERLKAVAQLLKTAESSATRARVMRVELRERALGALHV